MPVDVRVTSSEIHLSVRPRGLWRRPYIAHLTVPNRSGIAVRLAPFSLGAAIVEATDTVIRCTPLVTLDPLPWPLAVEVASTLNAALAAPDTNPLMTRQSQLPAPLLVTSLIVLVISLAVTHPLTHAVASNLVASIPAALPSPISTITSPLSLPLSRSVASSNDSLCDAADQPVTAPPPAAPPHAAASRPPKPGALPLSPASPTPAPRPSPSGVPIDVDDLFAQPPR